MWQILQVSSREQQQALQSGDLWAAVGPSSTLIPLAMRQSKIDLVAPASGTALWSHLWVVPRNSRISLPSGQSKVSISHKPSMVNFYLLQKGHKWSKVPKEPVVKAKSLRHVSDGI